MNITIPISPGEYFDRLSILVNKVYHCKKNEDVTQALRTFIQLSSCVPKILDYQWKEISSSLTELKDINSQLWDLEEAVRRPGEEVLREEMSDRIRELNGERSKAKNAINKQLGGAREVKDYGTS